MSTIIKNLLSNYNDICMKLVKKFVQKHKYEFSYNIGHIYCFIEQYYFNIEDIIYDLEHDLPADLIFQWQDDTLEAYSEKGTLTDVLNEISLKDYAEGKRYEQ